MLTTELTRRLGIEHPIVQAGMGPWAGWQLASAVSNAGALGTIGTIGRTPEQTEHEIAALREATTRPFAVNVLCFDWSSFAAGTLDVVIEARPPVVTLTFGDPSAGLARCKAAGLVASVQVQDVAGLRAAIDGRADFIIVQGNEAAGHTGRRGTLNFVAQGLELAGAIPIVAAGGIGNGRGLAAALAMGCAGGVMGTRFKATPECLAALTEKEEIVQSDGSNTIYDYITDVPNGINWPNGITGRALRSPFTEEWEGRTEELRAKVAGYPAFGFANELAEKGQAINWAGESSALVDRVRPAAEIVAETSAEAERLLARVAQVISATPVGAKAHR